MRCIFFSGKQITALSELCAFILCPSSEKKPHAIQNKQYLNLCQCAGRELCYVLLVGIVLSYSISFIILAEPSPASCAALR
jgi:hypothetical protein